MPEGRVELRKHPRRPAEGMTLTCYRTQAAAGYRPRRNIGEAVLDISAGGCRVRTVEPLEAGASLTIELRDAASGELFHAHGTVRWGDAKEADGRATCIAGVEFVEIYTPAAKRDRFLVGRVALQARPVREAPPPAKEAGASEPRPAERFHIDDYVVTAFRAGILSTVGLRKNIATSVVDLSRTGAQLACVEKVPPGTRIAFTLHLNKFADTFEIDAEVIWVKEDRGPDGPVWYTGVQFGSLAPTKQRLLDHMASWFTSYQAKYRQEHRS